MDHYLNQAEYTRWLRHYQMTMEHYLSRLDTIHQQIHSVSEETIQSSPGTKEKILKLLDTIEASIGEAIPRDFSVGAKPLNGMELFSENMKVLINFFYKLGHKAQRFKGIYETERLRVQQVHHTFNFKEKMMELQTMVHAFLPEERKNSSGTEPDIATNTSL